MALIKHTAQRTYATATTNSIRLNSQGVVVSPVAAKLLNVGEGDFITSAEDDETGSVYLQKAEDDKTGNKLGEKLTCGSLKEFQIAAKKLAGYPDLVTKHGNELEFTLEEIPYSADEAGVMTQDPKGTYFKVVFKQKNERQPRNGKKEGSLSAPETDSAPEESSINKEASVRTVPTSKKGGKNSSEDGF